MIAASDEEAANMGVNLCQIMLAFLGKQNGRLQLRDVSVGEFKQIVGAFNRI